MIYLKIQNDGEIDVNAFRLLGASTKDDSKIGYFGSGIKYALATALRNGISIKVFSGTKEIKISTKKTKLKDQQFEVICINNVPTGITTQTGRDWKDWFIVREFYCNALDEGGLKMEITDKLSQDIGKTNIFIEFNDKIKNVFDSFGSYFSEKRTPICTFGKDKIYRKLSDKMVIYRKGIRVFNEHNSLYDYDFDDLSINESRECSDFNAEWEIVSFWKDGVTENMIAELINNQDAYEYNMSWNCGVAYMSDVWCNYLSNKLIIPKELGGYFADDLAEYHIALSSKLCKELHKVFGKKLRIRGFEDKNSEFVILEPIEKEIKLISDVKNFLKCSGIKNIEDYPIKIAVLESPTLGEVKDGIIYLSRNLFSEGRRKIAETMLEEYIHAQNNVQDRTREMQDTLISLLISAFEEKTKIYL